MTWRKLDDDELRLFRTGDEPPRGKRWFTSPCLVIVEIDSVGAEASLLARREFVRFDAA